MFRRLIILGLPFIVSCGPKITIDKDPYFEEFITRFKSDAKINEAGIGAFNNILIFNFSELPSDINGQCIIKNEKIGIDLDIFSSIERFLGLFTIQVYRQIVFNIKTKMFPNDLQYQLFLHEIGHCAYHLSDNLDSHSIMDGDLNNLEDYLPQAINQFFIDAKNNQQNWTDNTPIPN